MAYGIIGYGQPGSVISTAQVGTSQMLPSGTIWGDCQNAELIDEGNGFFVSRDFKDVATLPGLPSQNGTFTYVSSTDSAMNIAFTSTGVAAVFTKPLAPVSANGNTKLWGEVSLNGSSTNQGIFVGFATSTGLSSTLIATSTTLLSTCGLIGFWLHGDIGNNFDAIYQNASSGGVKTVLSSTLTAAANNPNPANANSPNPIFPGAPGVLNGANWVKLGVRVDKINAYFYVNGAQVAKKALDSTFDTADSYGFIVAAGTQTNATDNLQVGFIRAAAKIAGQI